MADLTERNRAHWDAAAAQYNTHNSSAMEELIAEIRSRVDWIGVDFLDSDSEDEESDELARADMLANEDDVSGDQRTMERKSVRLLDYACGTGMVSRALSPYVSETIGIDLSANMATTYNTLANAQGLSATEMSAFVGNLLSPTDPHPSHFASEKFFNFDLAVVGLGFHHFEDPTLAATRLAERLKIGGVLMIIDFLPHGDDHVHGEGDAGEGGSSSGSGHHHHFHLPGHKKDDGIIEVKVGPDELAKAQATVEHHGFSEGEIKTAFEEAGVGREFGYVVVKRQVVFKSAAKTMKRSIFMARGSKG